MVFVIAVFYATLDTKATANSREAAQDRFVKMPKRGSTYEFVTPC